jgi:hypothetical protein
MTRGGDAVFGRLVREEAGMTMGLVVIMLVLIGVMGAGLLTFVQRDLEAVLAVNEGQQALAVADAGIEAARAQLAQNGFANQYNDPATAPFSPDPANSSWAFNSSSATCGALPSGPGRCIITGEGEVRVTIRYLPPPATEEQRTSPNHAPEALAAGTEYPDGRQYYRVESDGSADGARRKIQAILITQPFGAPITYYATGNVTFNGDRASLTDTSVFAGGNVTGARENLVTGIDRVYGNWLRLGYNDSARPGNDLNPALAANRAGVAAEGTITYAPGGGDVEKFNNTRQKAGTQTASMQRYGKVDFDNRGTDSADITPTAGVSPYAFCEKGSTCWPSGNQPGGVITYPFDPTERADLDFLKRLAISQDNYILNPTIPFKIRGSNQSTNPDAYPIPSPENTVYFVEFTGAQGRVEFEVDAGTNPKASGVIVVVNGDFLLTSAGVETGGGGFVGAVILHDPNPTDSAVMTYEAQGNSALEGFVNVEGNMILGGSSSPFLGNGAHALPGFHQVKVWSWRECYSATCT